MHPLVIFATVVATFQHPTLGQTLAREFLRSQNCRTFVTQPGLVSFLESNENHLDFPNPILALDTFPKSQEKQVWNLLQRACLVFTTDFLERNVDRLGHLLTLFSGKSVLQKTFLLKRNLSTTDLSLNKEFVTMDFDGTAQGNDILTIQSCLISVSYPTSRETEADKNVPCLQR